MGTWGLIKRKKQKGGDVRISKNWGERVGKKGGGYSKKWGCLNYFYCLDSKADIAILLLLDELKVIEC